VIDMKSILLTALNYAWQTTLFVWVNTIIFWTIRAIAPDEWSFGYFLYLFVFGMPFPLLMLIVYFIFFTLFFLIIKFIKKESIFLKLSIFFIYLIITIWIYTFVINKYFNHEKKTIEFRNDWTLLFFVLGCIFFGYLIILGNRKVKQKAIQDI
jgi:hypothetical protein